MRGGGAGEVRGGRRVAGRGGAGRGGARCLTEMFIITSFPLWSLPRWLSRWTGAATHSGGGTPKASASFQFAAPQSAALFSAGFVQ